jgi:hypothetical protein
VTALQYLWRESRVGNDMAMSPPTEPPSPPPSDLPEPAARMLYELAVSNLRQQRASLDEMRTRAGALLSATSISNAFLGAVAARGSGPLHLPLRFWIALGPFGGSVALCICVLWYTGNWKFSLRPDELGDTIPSDMPTDKIYQGLTAQLVWMNDENSERIKHRSWIFAAAAIATMIAIGAWLYLIE